MTGKERTLAAIIGERTDRPPFDFWAEDTALNRLYAYLGHDNLDKFLDEAGVDIRGFRALEPEHTCIGNGFYQNMWGERYTFRNSEWGGEREDTLGALYEARSLEEIMAFPWPNNDMIDYRFLWEQINEARDKKLAIRYGFADIWQRPALVRGLQNHLADMIINPEWVHWLSRKFTDFYIEEYKRAWEVSRGNIDIFLVISDMGAQKGPLFSVDMFEEFVAPYLREMTDVIHGMGAKNILHSCGAIASFIPSIIRCGVDILNPIQPTHSDMSPEALKVHSGQICFHGGIDIQQILPYGTEEEVQNEVRRYAELLGPRYIACPAHLFQPDTPAENIVAFYKAFERI